MEDPLLYDRELEDVIDFFNEKKKTRKFYHVMRQSIPFVLYIIL